jgi:hypothetical protein
MQQRMQQVDMTHWYSIQSHYMDQWLSVVEPETHCHC